MILPRLAVAFAILSLSGCLSAMDLYYRAGARVAQQQRVTYQCEQLARSTVPVAISHEEVEDYSTRRVCNADGSNCRRERVLVGTDWVTKDVNADLRNRVRRQCFNDKGYVQVRIPACSDNLRNAVTPRATRVLPTLTENSCVIKYEDGSYQIITGG